MVQLEVISITNNRVEEGVVSVVIAATNGVTGTETRDGPALVDPCVVLTDYEFGDVTGGRVGCVGIGAVAASCSVAEVVLIVVSVSVGAVEPETWVDGEQADTYEYRSKSSW